MTNPRTTYRENDVRGATAVRLVVLLYEQLVQDLTHAAQAFQQNEIELRTRYINHAILVIGHLQSPLDFANGGKVAEDLDSFYSVLRQNLVQVQFYPSKTGLGQLITDVLAVRESWIEVERAEKSLAATAAVTTAAGSLASSSTDLGPDQVRMEWQG